MHLETSSFSMHVSRNSSKAEFILQRFHDHCSVVSDYSRFGSIELTYKFFIDIFSELNEYKSEKTFELIFFFFLGIKEPSNLLLTDEEGLLLGWNDLVHACSFIDPQQHMGWIMDFEASTNCSSVLCEL